MSFPAILSAARTRTKLSQEALAERSGVNRVSIARFENGAREPTLSTLKRLVESLDSRFANDVKAYLTGASSKPKKLSKKRG